MQQQQPCVHVRVYVMAVDSEAVSWPIILHQSLAESELHQHLKAKQYRIRSKFSQV